MYTHVYVWMHIYIYTYIKLIYMVALYAVYICIHIYIYRKRRHTHTPTSCWNRCDSGAAIFCRQISCKYLTYPRMTCSCTAVFLSCRRAPSHGWFGVCGGGPKGATHTHVMSEPLRLRSCYFLLSTTMSIFSLSSDVNLLRCCLVILPARAQSRLVWCARGWGGRHHTHPRHVGFAATKELQMSVVHINV